MSPCDQLWLLQQLLALQDAMSCERQEPWKARLHLQLCMDESLHEAGQPGQIRKAAGNIGLPTAPGVLLSDSLERAGGESATDVLTGSALATYVWKRLQGMSTLRTIHIFPGGMVSVLWLPLHFCGLLLSKSE